MDISKRLTAGRAPAGTLAQDYPIAGAHPDAHARHIGIARGIAPAAVIDAFEMDHFAIPAAKPENGIGLGDGKPALNIGYIPTLDVTGVDMAAVQFSAQGTDLSRGK